MNKASQLLRWLHLNDLKLNYWTNTLLLLGIIRIQTEIITHITTQTMKK
jgi:hypothetical protein